ncbi:MAG: hypothetical protein WC956_02790 [bacterium]
MVTKSIEKTSEILVVTKNNFGTLAGITSSFATGNIGITCFTGYEWNGEAAFRFVTNNNRKACDILKSYGYTVYENPVAVWYTDNSPTQMKNATTALAEAKVNTHCMYTTSVPNSNSTVMVFNTNNVDRTITVLNSLC